MPAIFFKSLPFVKEDVTLALESGVDGIITDAAHIEAVSKLAVCEVRADTAMPALTLAGKEDEEKAATLAGSGKDIVLTKGWEVIPVENLLARPEVAPHLALEVASADEARLAAGILEKGVPILVLLPETLPDMKKIVADLKVSQGKIALEIAVVREVRSVGLGHRVCVDTLSLLHRGQGMLVGNSSAFTFLVHAETEHNDYVAARPFRINAGGVHSYLMLPHDRTAYAGEIAPADEVLIVDNNGQSSLATVGRIKTEVRPMLYIHAESENDPSLSGGIFLQNAETIRLVRADGEPISVVDLRPGDRILCRLDSAGRHFGMRIQENIQES